MSKSNLLIAVIICSHNPRKVFLNRVLASLQAQTLLLSQWELLLIDNISNSTLASEFDLSWHPNGRHISEMTPGLTPARLRGIHEATADLLVFVDDDNVLEANYLEQASFISKNWPMLGAWGGQIRPEFEHQPPEWTRRYWKSLAIREFDKDQWSNLVHQSKTTPYGAGLCVRKYVAERYRQVVLEDSRRLNLDRKGQLLTSCGDLDLAYTACDIGLGTGLFTALQMTHLIPSARLEESYLLRLVEGTRYSKIILNSFRGSYPHKSTLRYRISQYIKRLRMNKRQRRFFDADNRGRDQAIKELFQQNNSLAESRNSCERSTRNQHAG
ncbi:MAG: glycosyltransferase [Caldilineaceae bacterium]